MTGLAVALGVLAVVAIAVAAVAWRRLTAARLALAEEQQRSGERGRELAAANTAREEATTARSEAESRADGADEQASASQAAAKTSAKQASDAENRAVDADARSRSAEERAASAEQRAAEADTAREQARADADAAAETAHLAEARAAAAEEAVRTAATVATSDDTTPSPSESVDPRLLWTLEQLRSERTWQQSVAVGNETASVFEETDNRLREAVQVEVDALREEVGAVVDLDVELPDGVTAAGSLLVLRVAQELLAGVVHDSAETVLRIRVEEGDALVTVHSIDGAGQALERPPLLGTSSATAEPIDGGIRIRDVIAPI